MSDFDAAKDRCAALPFAVAAVRGVDAATVLADWTHSGNAEDVLDTLGFWDSEQASYLLNESVFDALNEVAPENTSFGSSEGDGASFGFWENDLEDYDEDDEDEEASASQD
jgi:hypothetical protein